MKSIRVDIAGGAQRIWVAADAEGVSVWNGVGVQNSRGPSVLMMETAEDRAAVHAST